VFTATAIITATVLICPPSRCKKRKQSVETVFGIIKSVMGFWRFNLRGIQNVATEWTLIALA